MFNNILYFIVALLIYEVHQPDPAARTPFPEFLILMTLTWAALAAYCRWGFRNLLRRVLLGRVSEGAAAAAYHRLVFKNSVACIVVFTLAVYTLDLKAWLLAIPFFRVVTVLPGIAALSFLLFCFSTLWYEAHPAYEALYRPGMTRLSFVISNLRLNAPILLPWVLLTLLFDLIELSPLASPGGFLSRAEGQMLLFGVFLAVLMVFLPVLIRVLWGCRPVEPSERVIRLKAFLTDLGFRYREMLRWPIFQGKMMTAGVMGLVPRYRYILISDALLAALSLEELKAVMAHETAHVRYRHLLLYLVFFVGFVAISYGLYDVIYYLFFLLPSLTELLAEGGPRSVSLFYLLLSIPMLAVLLVYFRYIMGFFMRHFERQADLYSARVMGTPRYTISSLEKIALASGKIRDLPSWHHFSIRERVSYLLRTLSEPGLSRRHDRMVWWLLLIYLTAVSGFAYLLNFSPVKDRINVAVAERALRAELRNEPQNPMLLRGLAMVYQEQGRDREAAHVYERVIATDPDDAISLNNLAWLMLTAKEPDLRDDARALELSKRAVSLDRSPVYLDTLAEAYYANGLRHEAVETIREALARATENRGYYRSQLDRFRSQAP